MINDPEQLFDSETLRTFESAGLLARRLVRGRLRADRRSFTRGVSVEFAEYRPFVNGDDIRALDWNAFARWRQLVLKLFVEEEDLHVYFLLDCSASMEWGSPSKFDLARRVLAGLAWISLANLDRAAFIPLGRSSEERVPPLRGRNLFQKILASLAACRPVEGPVSLQEQTRAWLATSPRKGLVIFLGDLFGKGRGDALGAIERIRHSGHELGVIQILDPAELEPPAFGEYELQDCETGEIRQVVVDQSRVLEFQLESREFLEEIDGISKKFGVPCLRTGNTAPLRSVLSSVLAWQ